MTDRGRLEALRDELVVLGERPVTLPAWDPYILGEHDQLQSEVMTAREAARRELERWRAGRFPSVVLAVADAVFSKQKDYGVAVRNWTRPFAQFFSRMKLAEFCAFDADNAYRLTFGSDPRPGKERAHLAPEGRLRSIRGVCRVLDRAGVASVEAARAALQLAGGQPGLPDRMTAVFGFGDLMLANTRMNLGVLTLKSDVHLARFLSARLGLPESTKPAVFARVLEEGQGVLGLEPFEVDQIVWYTSAGAGKT